MRLKPIPSKAFGTGTRALYKIGENTSGVSPVMDGYIDSMARLIPITLEEF